MLFQCRPNLLEGVTVASNGPKRTPLLNIETLSKNIQIHITIQEVFKRIQLALSGGSVAGWLGRWTCNLEAPISSPALTASCINLFSVVPSSNPRPCL